MLSHRKNIMYAIAFDALARLAKDRNFQVRAIVAAIVLTAVKKALQEGISHSFTELTSWAERFYGFKRRPQPAELTAAD